MSSVENPWAWQGHNPYLSTAFQIVDVDTDADSAAIRTRATVRRRRIAHAAERFPVFGRTLTVAEINEAEEQLGDPRGRLLNELLTHPPEVGDADPAELADLLEVLDDAGYFGSPDDTDRARRSPVADLLDPRVLSSLLPDPSARTFAPVWVDDDAEQ
jgi:hypothetical protein